MMGNGNARSWLKPGTRTAGVAAALLGAAVVLGWYTHSPKLIQLRPGLVPMQFNTALGMLLSGLLLAIPAARWRTLRLILAALVAILGIATLCEFVFGVSFGIDQLFGQYYITALTTYPGRMAPGTALGFALIGASTALCSRCTKQTAAPIFGITGSIVMGLGFASLMGYLLHIPVIFVWLNSSLMAAHTALGFMLLGSGLLAAACDLPSDRHKRIPRWPAVAAGIGILTVDIVLWEALRIDQGTVAQTRGHELLLAYGVGAAILLGLLINWVQRARTSAIAALRASRLLEQEFAARLLAEQENRESAEQLRQAQKLEAVGQLTGGIAHDFNNMLGIVSGNLELLEPHLDGDCKASAYLGNAMQGVHRATALTQKLLTFSRRQMLQPVVLDLNEQVRDMMELLQRTLGETIKLEAVYATDLWPCRADRSQLESALLNLALNARDAMPDGGTLTIRTNNIQQLHEHPETHAEPDLGPCVMLAVSDNGAGMPEAVRRRVFEPFFTTKQVGAGSGLGLSMIHGFIRQSNGWINIHSVPGEGTSIKLYLPRYRGAQKNVAPAREVTDAIGGHETILLVEDEADLLKVIAAQLRALGYNVYCAGNADEALSAIRANPRVDLLLTDVMLPGGKNGRDTADECLALKGDVKVLYMSGYTGDDIGHQGRLDDDAVLLIKPFTTSDLARSIRAVLDA